MQYEGSLHRVYTVIILTMSKRFTLDIQEDDYGDIFVTLPQDLLTECGWDVGDVLEYSIDTDESVTLTKVDE